MGSLNHDRGAIVCDSHSGGTATCTEKARYSICGTEYGDLLPHNLTKIEAKAPTCTEAGNTEYWTCNTCGKLPSKEKEPG